jgi:hypothetical protein
LTTKTRYDVIIESSSALITLINDPRYRDVETIVKNNKKIKIIESIVHRGYNSLELLTVQEIAERIIREMIYQASEGCTHINNKPRKINGSDICNGIRLTPAIGRILRDIGM